MEFCSSKRRPHGLLVLLLILSCLLLPLAASVPLSRSQFLGNHEAPSGFQVAAQAVASREGRRLGGGGTGRMDIEVNDYPGSGANNRHDPKSPGRA